MVSDHFWKNTFLTHCLSQNNPFSVHFVALEGPKMACNGLKKGSFSLV